MALSVTLFIGAVVARDKGIIERDTFRNPLMGWRSLTIVGRFLGGFLFMVPSNDVFVAPNLQLNRDPYKIGIAINLRDLKPKPKE
jgi:hypothetical protein